MEDTVSDMQGNAFVLRPIDCPTCGPAPKRLLGDRGGRHQRWRLGVATRIVQCERCTLVFPDPFPFPLDLERLYGEPGEYFAAHDLVDKLRLYRVHARGLKSRCVVDDPVLLDVGAGRGDFLFAARLEGFRRLRGIEASARIAAFGSQYLGVHVETLLIEDLAAQTPAPRFDAIALLGVLEHVHDPDAFVRAVAGVAAPGAPILIDVPQEPNLLTMVGNTYNRLRGDSSVYNLQPTWAPFHVFGFNPRALRALLGKYGIEIEALSVHASPRVRSSSGFVDRAKSLVATQVNRVANWTGLAANMLVWARAR